MFCVVFFFFLFRIMFRIIIIIGVRGEQRQNNRERKSDKEKAAAGRAQQTKGGMWAWVFFSLFFAVFLNYIYVALGCSLILIPMHFSESCAMHYERAKTRIWGSLLHASLPSAVCRRYLERVRRSGAQSFICHASTPAAARTVRTQRTVHKERSAVVVVTGR